MPKPINLFEFTKYSFDNSFELKDIELKKQFSDDLEDVLENIWEERKKFIPSENLYYDSTSSTQRIIDFKKKELIPRNWIGTIHLRSNEQEYVVNLLPKIFYIEKHEYSDKEIDSIFAHVLWWLSGSEKQNYSTMQSSMGAIESNFLEILVYMFSTYILEIISTNSYTYYETISEEIQTVKGQIDFNNYAINYSNGKRNILPCKYDSLQYDNQFNRIVKYVTTLLKDFTKNDITKKNLEEILFILDEVDYTIVTTDDCEKVVLNPIYTEFKTILDNCKLFLSSLSVYKWKDDCNVFALLIPSEKLFENFIYSTLKNNSDSIIKSVKRNRPGRTYLVKQLPNNNPRFRMINDIVVQLEDKSYILFDTKYKKIYNSKEVEDIDPIYNISQSDIYQMVSYAVGSGISDIGLLYPKLLEENTTSELPIYEIEDEFTNDVKIKIYPFKVNIIHEEGLKMGVDGKLENIFFKANEKLIHQLNQIVKRIKIK